MKHINIKIIGRVQGVGFRRAARDEARYLGIKGYIRNEPDGSVYLEAEGDELAISQFVIWCRKGSVYSYVEEIYYSEGDVMGFSSFESRY